LQRILKLFSVILYFSVEFIRGYAIVFSLPAGSTNNQQNQPTMNYELLIDNDGTSSSIQLTEQDYNEIERLLQWPEDLAAYDRSNSPINLVEIDSLIA
jgi:hypothetical protein